MRKKVAIIGAGVSGLTVAQELNDKCDVTVFEKESTPGGLIRCKNIDGSLFHICGGHVFNTKRKDVFDWFREHFNMDDEFHKSERNSVVFFDDDLRIPYPIENHFYLMNPNIQQKIICDLIELGRNERALISNFEEFLKNRFGKTLYELYFRPYNEKVWRRELTNVPLAWLEGKLPMPSVSEIIYNNINHIEEKQFVHSSFYYENHNGSQFIADRLAEGINVKYDFDIENIEKSSNGYVIDSEIFDLVVFTGNIKQLFSMMKGIDVSSYFEQINDLEYHGTTSVFCEMDNNPYSWIYLPSKNHSSHRIICTGNFSVNNNENGKMTGTIEFTDEINKDDIIKNLEKIQLHPKYIEHYYSKYTYPIQSTNTREMIKSLKLLLEGHDFYFTGRFADWEYYNMDAAIESAIELSKKINLKYNE